MNGYDPRILPPEHVDVYHTGWWMMYYPNKVIDHRYFRKNLQNLFEKEYPADLEAGTIPKFMTAVQKNGQWRNEPLPLWLAMESAGEFGSCPIIVPGYKENSAIVSYNWHQYVRAAYHASHVCTEGCAPGYAPGTRDE